MPPLDADEPGLQPGRSLSHYRILQRLGAGSGGEVYLAEDLKLERRVALKLIPPQLAADEDSLERFEREARTLAILNHPSIVTIYSVEEDGGFRFLTMELVEGRTLSELIPEGGLPLARFLEIAIPLVDALRVAHLSGITHRDLKPANIMVSVAGRVKVLDFGLAKLQRDEAALGGSRVFEKSLTQAGIILGTLQYMSPEQLEGKPVDPRSDLFSLGIIFHEMATGERPFQGDSGPALISSIFRDDPPSVREFRAELPEELAGVILRCLEKNPDDRYPSAGDLLQDLEALPGMSVAADSAVEPSAGDAEPGRASGARSTRSAALPRSTAQRNASLAPASPSRAAGPAPPPPAIRRRRFAVLALSSILLVAGGLLVGLRAYRGLAHRPARIVVLPFENLGQAEDAYFSAGITEEITSRLSAVQGLGLISRNSALQYEKTSKTTRQIGQELGVNYLLEGTVRWDHAPDGSSRVRVNPELIRVADDTHLWSEQYERDVRAIFEVQTEIAEQVVQKLNLTLQNPEKRALEAKSTNNLDAHLAYLRGMAYGRGATDKDFYLAVQMFQQAVTLDPGYVDAYYRLSRAQAYLYGSGNDHTPARLALAKQAADHVRELAPDSPLGHAALGNYYLRAVGDFDRALEEYALVLKESPNDSNALYNVGYIQMEKGLWEDGVSTMEKAQALDPQNGDVAQDLGEVYERLRQYRQAEGAFDRAIAIAPDDLLAFWRKVDLYWIWDGAPQRARRVLESVPRQADSEWARNWFYQEYYERNWQGALDRIAGTPWDAFDGAPKSYLEYLCYFRLGKPQKARESAETARATLEKAVKASADDPWLHSWLGLAYAALGRKEDAVREGERAVSLAPVAKNPYLAPYHVIRLAKIYAQVGELGRAMDQIEYLLSIPSCFSVGMLRLDPDWDRLRGFPRFEKLVASP